MAAKQGCPICKAAVRPYPRYPRYVCRKCAERVRSSDGRPLEFFNRDLSGGFVARYADTRKAYRGHDCFIDGVRCYADEAKFGGIVIQAVEPPTPGTPRRSARAGGAANRGPRRREEC
jgi:hypothetical protein